MITLGRASLFFFSIPPLFVVLIVDLYYLFFFVCLFDMRLMESITLRLCVESGGESNEVLSLDEMDWIDFLIKLCVELNS